MSEKKSPEYHDWLNNHWTKVLYLGHQKFSPSDVFRLLNLQPFTVSRVETSVWGISVEEYVELDWVKIKI